MTNIIINGKEIEKTSEITACKKETIIKGSSLYDQGRKGHYLFMEGQSFKIEPFIIGQYEVTQELYKAVLEGNNICDTNPSKFKFFPKEGEVQERRPVEQVTWYDAVFFCNELTKQTMGEEHCVYSITDIKRSEKPAFHEPGAFEFVAFFDNVTVEQYTGHGSKELQYEESDKGYIYSARVTADYSKKGYRLPTEVEWEFAARGAKEISSKNFGKMILSGVEFGEVLISVQVESENPSEVAWYSVNSEGRTHEVGLKKPNNLGLYDMSGNVFEWCSDKYEHDGFDDGIVRFGKEYQTRGGDFNHNERLTSVARRFDRDAATRACSVGFRLARTF